MRKNLILISAAAIMTTSCAMSRKDVTGNKLASDTSSNTVVCTLDIRNYASNFNDAVLTKARHISVATDTSLSASKFALDTAILKPVALIRSKALKLLCERCNACNFYKQDSLLFIEVLNKGYCGSYTLYVLDKKDKGLVYQTTCSTPVCALIKSSPDKSLLNVHESRKTSYDILYIRTSCLRMRFFTQDISFLSNGEIKNTLF